jgi:ectoine hydroxylase-related dioxygenase (phytanoyl-CoA dioxygenase family)
VGKALSQRQVADYQTRGILFPVPAIGGSEARHLLQRLEKLEKSEGGKISRRTNFKPHLLLCWLNELIRDSRVLDPVEDLIGPDLLCWGTDFFIKNPGDKRRVTWHQDSTYWGLSSSDIVTAWVAFTPSTVESGCMRVVPGSHLKDQLPHRDTFAPDNLLSRGQEIAVTVNERQAVDVVLDQGQMSLHHVRLVHGSEPNRAAHRRVGFAIRYVPTYVRQLSGTGDSATLVRGHDAVGHFIHEPTPGEDFHPDAVAFHAKAFEAQMEIFYAGAAKRPDQATLVGEKERGGQ